MGKIVDLTGQRFGKLVAIKCVGSAASGGRLWHCECDCGGEGFYTAGSLRSGNRTSCGCNIYPQRIFMIGEVGICFIKNSGYFWFDEQDLPLVESRQWSIIKDGYIGGWANGNTRKLHRLILGITDPAIIVDHINGDKCDNRRSNLRLATHAQNVQHSTKYIKGYYFNKTTGRYQARIKVNGEFIYLGEYATKDEARAVYFAAQEKYHGMYKARQKIIWFPGYNASEADAECVSWKNMSAQWVDFLQSYKVA